MTRSSPSARSGSSPPPRSAAAIGPDGLSPAGDPATPPPAAIRPPRSPRQPRWTSASPGLLGLRRCPRSSRSSRSTSRRGAARTPIDRLRAFLPWGYRHSPSYFTAEQVEYLSPGVVMPRPALVGTPAPPPHPHPPGRPVRRLHRGRGRALGCSGQSTRGEPRRPGRSVGPASARGGRQLRPPVGRAVPAHRRRLPRADPGVLMALGWENEATVLNRFTGPAPSTPAAASHFSTAPNCPHRIPMADV